MKTLSYSQLNSVDEESQKFIKWSFDQIVDDSSLVTMIEEVTADAKSWLLDNRTTVRDLLFAKMIKGAKEHGAPKHSIEAVNKELEGEYLDLLGWTQIKKYNQDALQSRNSNRSTAKKLDR